MEYAQSHEWGHDFRICGQAVRRNTLITAPTKHDQTSYYDIVAEYAVADRVHVLKEALVSTEEQANQVSDLASQLDALQQAMYEDYEESVISAKVEVEKKKKKKSRHSRVPSVHSRGRSRLRGHTKNKCKHCKKYREYAICIAAPVSSLFLQQEIQRLATEQNLQRTGHFKFKHRFSSSFQLTWVDIPVIWSPRVAPVKVRARQHPVAVMNDGTWVRIVIGG